MNIAFDLDGVLYPWQVAAYEYYMYFHSRNRDISYNEFYTDFIHDQSPVAIENLIRIPTLYTSFVPKKSVLKVLNSLAKAHDIFYITARPIEFKSITEQYLKTYNFPCLDNLIFSTDKTVHVRANSIDYFVEDSPKHVESAKTFTKCFILNQPWNESYTSTEVTRIYSLNDLCKNLC